MPLEPTLGEVMAELRELRGELRTQRLENRTGFAEVKGELATLRLDFYTRLDDLRRQVGTVIDELAAFRAEYNSHTHED